MIVYIQLYDRPFWLNEPLAVHALIMITLRHVIAPECVMYFESLPCCTQSVYSLTITSKLIHNLIKLLAIYELDLDLCVFRN